MGASRYEILSTLPPGSGARTRLAWQVGDGGFRRAVVLRQVPEGVEALTLPTPQAVLPLLDLVHLEDADWAVYEFVPGATFAEVSAAHFSVERLPSLGLIARTVVDACRAIHQVHSFVDPLGLIASPKHGGLSDASIFIGFDGVTRVLDLGARRLAKFIAPEVARGEQFDARADVFSLGAVLHHATTRFDKGYAVTIARAPSPAEFPPPSTVHPEATPELDAVVMRALMPSASSRFASALQLAEELEAVLGPVLFSTEQVHAVLLPLFGDRIAALKELVDPKKRPPAPRPSAPKKRIPEPLIDADVKLDGGAFDEIADIPTQANIKLPPHLLRPGPPVPQFDPHATGPGRAPTPAPDFDPNATTPGRGLADVAPNLAASLGMARPSRPSGPKRADTVSGRRPVTQPDDEKERARGQEKISTADLDPDQLSPEMKALQDPDLALGSEIEAVPTNIKPRPSQIAIQAIKPEPSGVFDNSASFDDPKKKESTLDVEHEDAPPALKLTFPKKRGPLLVLVTLLMVVGFGVATVVFRPDLVAKLKARINPPPPGAEEVLPQDADGGEAVAEVDGGKAPLPTAVASTDAGSADGGDDDEDELPALSSDGGGDRDGGKGKPGPVKKKKKKRNR